MPCKPTCGNEPSQTGESARGFLRKIWMNINGRFERYISELLLSKQLTQFRLHSPMNGTTLSHRTRSIIWNISWEVRHDPSNTYSHHFFPICVHLVSSFPRVSFLFHSALSLIQHWLLFHQQRKWEFTLITIWSFVISNFRLLSILVCLSKDVTGALVCSRGHSSSSFIIVRFLMTHAWEATSTLVCLSKDVTGALVCSRWHSSSSFILVKNVLPHAWPLLIQTSNSQYPHSCVFMWEW